VLLHTGLNWILAYAAAKRLGEERRTGGFEVLLTTPLDVRDMVEGYLRGLLVRFRPVAALLLLLDAALMYISIAGRDWPAPAIFACCLVWATMIWFWFAIHVATVPRAMWIAAWTGRPGYAALQSMRSYFWVLILLGIPAVLGDYGASICFGFFVIPAIALGGFSSRKLLRQKLIFELRAIAAAPIPAKGDKRFKRWNPRHIYPPGLWGNFDWQQMRPRRRP